MPEIQVTDHAPLIHTPPFWNPEKAYEHYRPDLATAYIQGVERARAAGKATAQALIKGGVSNLIMLTDLQSDFRDDGRLAVKGTNDVVLRVCTRTLNGFEEDFYTHLIFSLDGHPPQHVSYSVRYRFMDGRPFDLSANKAAILVLIDRKKAVFKATCFNPADGSPIDMGYVQSHFDARDSVAYWDHMQATGQGPIWVFDIHCMIGSEGMALHPLLQETVSYVSGLRSIMPGVINKGHIVNTDWFGPLLPCRPDPSHPQGGLQKDVLDEFDAAQIAEFAGVAEDFCEFNMEKQTLDHLNPGMKEKLRFIEDCTAPIVPNAAHVIAHRKRARAEGVVFINHDAPFTTAA